MKNKIKFNSPINFKKYKIYITIHLDNLIQINLIKVNVVKHQIRLCKYIKNKFKHHQTYKDNKNHVYKDINNKISSNLYQKNNKKKYKITNYYNRNHQRNNLKYYLSKILQ